MFCQEAWHVYGFVHDDTPYCTGTLIYNTVGPHNNADVSTCYRYHVVP